MAHLWHSYHLLPSSLPWRTCLRIFQTGTIRLSKLAHGFKHLGTLLRYVIKVAFKLVKKGRIISKMILEKLANSLEKKRVILYFTLYPKINSRWIKGLNVKKKKAGKSLKII